MCALATAPVAAEVSRLPEPQTRGYVINLVREMSPGWLELEVRRIAEAGFNLIVFPAFNNGWTLFPSEAGRAYGLKLANPLFRKWNPLETIGQLAREAGLTLWAYARPYHFHPRHSVVEHRLLRKHPEWRLRAHPDFTSAATRRFERWHACPLNTEYRRFLGDVLVELVAGYPVEGLVLHYEGLGLTGGGLADSPYCFCASCRQQYDAAYGADLVDDAAGGQLERVRAWQMRQVQEHYLYLRHRLIRTRRSLRLVCRARPTWRQDAAYPEPPEAGALLIDWPALLSVGAIEELAVDHDGEPCDVALGARLAADYAYLGDRTIFLPVVSVDDPTALDCPLDATARFPTPGFLAEFQTNLTDELALQIRDRFFPTAAPLPESEPVRAAAYLLSRVRLLHEDQPIIHDLLYDILRLLARQLPQPSDFGTLQVIEQNLQGFEQYIRRGRLGRRIPERTMRDLGLARRLIRMACMDVRS